MEPIQNYINGEFVEPISNEYIDVINPAIGEKYTVVANSNKKDIDKAVDAAQESFFKWSVLSLENRSDYLIQIANEIENNLDEFAYCETKDTGKPISLSKKMDIPRAIANFRFFAEFAKSFHFESEINDGKSSNVITRFPLGVVGCISPWNLPLYLFTWKIAPAIISGNTVIAKPSEISPLTAYKLSQVLAKINFPRGVINIVHGDGNRAGSEIVRHPKIKAVSFTGGTNTGTKIAQESAPTLKKLSLEMGGKNPAIIFDDCNYSNMLNTVINSSFSNQGQICLCSSRLLIHSSIYTKFKSDLIDSVSKLKIGDPNEIDTEFGAISSKEHYDKILHYIELAKKEGGNILIGGEPLNITGRCNNGYFVAPTVIDSLDNSSIINQDEIFGPVVTLQAFDSEDEAVNIANNIDYGLSATIWSNDTEKSNRVASNINAGVIWINCWLVRDLRTPFGGMKQSGLGREGGDYALDFFTETKNICRSL
jgi:aminomuconate-semialdehyde/2-hydroxymuconate-6-semialdehyde dehydrogenase